MGQAVSFEEHPAKPEGSADFAKPDVDRSADGPTVPARPARATGMRGVPAKLPEPVTVQVASKSKRKSEAVVEKSPAITRGAVGTFHPSLYLTRGDCIECNGELMSRGRFEKLAGTATAKWHVSIKVQPSGMTLGKWLLQHGLPVLKQGKRRKRPAVSDDDDMDEEDEDEESISFRPSAQAQARAARDRPRSEPSLPKAATAAATARRAAAQAAPALVAVAVDAFGFNRLGGGGVVSGDADGDGATDFDGGKATMARSNSIMSVEMLACDPTLAPTAKAPEPGVDGHLFSFLEGSGLLDELLDGLGAEDAVTCEAQPGFLPDAPREAYDSFNGFTLVEGGGGGGGSAAGFGFYGQGGGRNGPSLDPGGGFPQLDSNCRPLSVAALHNRRDASSFLNDARVPSLDPRASPWERGTQPPSASCEANEHSASCTLESPAYGPREYSSCSLPTPADSTRSGTLARSDVVGGEHPPPLCFGSENTGAAFSGAAASVSGDGGGCGRALRRIAVASDSAISRAPHGLPSPMIAFADLHLDGGQRGGAWHVPPGADPWSGQSQHMHARSGRLVPSAGAEHAMGPPGRFGFGASGAAVSQRHPGGPESRHGALNQMVLPPGGLRHGARVSYPSALREPLHLDASMQAGYGPYPTERVHQQQQQPRREAFPWPQQRHDVAPSYLASSEPALDARWPDPRSVPAWGAQPAAAGPLAQQEIMANTGLRLQ